MNEAELTAVVNDVSVGDLFDTPSFLIHGKGDGFLLQLTFKARCTVTGEQAKQHCRKWFVSRHATNNEVIGTCFAAVLAALEHEAREHFRYRGRAIFNPHVSVEKLHEVCVHTVTRGASR